MVAPTVSVVGCVRRDTRRAWSLTVTARSVQRPLDRWQVASLPAWAMIVWIAGIVIVPQRGAADRLIPAMQRRIRVPAPHTPEPWTSPPESGRSGPRTLSARWPMLLGMALVVTVGLTQFTDPWIATVQLVTNDRRRTSLGAGYPSPPTGRDCTCVTGSTGWPSASDATTIASQPPKPYTVRPADWVSDGATGFSLTLMKRASVVLRAGPGIRVDFHDGKVFVVTIPHPDKTAGLLNVEASRLTACRTRVHLAQSE